MTDKQSAGSRMLASVRKAREMDPRETHIRALGSLMAPSWPDAEIEEFLRAGEWSLALSSLAALVEGREIVQAEQIVTHDPKYGLSYIYLAGKTPKGGAARQIRAGEGIILDLDADGHLIGIELLKADLLHPPLKARAVRPEEQS